MSNWVDLCRKYRTLAVSSIRRSPIKIVNNYVRPKVLSVHPFSMRIDTVYNANSFILLNHESTSRSVPGRPRVLCWISTCVTTHLNITSARCPRFSELTNSEVDVVFRAATTEILVRWLSIFRRCIKLNFEKISYCYSNCSINFHLTLVG